MATSWAGVHWELVLFEVGGRRLSLPVGSVREVLRVVTIIPLPSGGPRLEGVMNRRGEVVPVLDLRAWLGLPPAPAEPDHQLIIAEGAGRLVALRVDRVLELVKRTTADGVEAGEGRHEGRDDFAGLARHPEGLVPILDPDQLSAEAKAACAGAAGPAASQAGGEGGGS